ncbi:hypothetical protein O7626_37075 [Micromonospora sp. WMMD1102]|uniref:hypothetical protein n=1 Tax=Micromonospora sp. WMMD1102 TaxID=3016105 RepID=UPI002414FA49|nr:hypothetical protein [Micromonospora sp. WMMD1102]MDG4791444.1 hypothetical protein [Micromonospora sp. WMMD1102]
MSVGEAKARLQQGVESAGVARTIIEAIATDTGDAARLAQTTLYDSEHPEATRALACLKSATDELDLVVRRIDISVEAANEYRETLG